MSISVLPYNEEIITIIWVFNLIHDISWVRLREELEIPPLNEHDKPKEVYKFYPKGQYPMNDTKQ